MLVIRDLDVCVDQRPILKKFSLTIKAGEVHAIMGPNGAGKSTLAKILAGHPSYEVTGGEILFEGQNIVEMAPEERARLGLFLSFQHPIEIPGLTNFQFLHAAYQACHAKISEEEFDVLLQQKIEQMHIKSEIKTRNLNEGFSGGEKKKNELLQMAILQPKLTILDEIDSGLDIDAMKDVAQGVKMLLTQGRAVLIVTHYQRLLEHLKPHFVHVMVEGQIVKTGGPQLALELEEQGYHVYS
jgi:Fe-S cluster assembly ATP-binding protein